MNTRFCTYFDQHYLTRGIAMIDSLLSFMPQADITVLCLDPLTQVLLRRMYPRMQRLLLQDLEATYPDLIKAKTDRTPREYFWTLTPCLIEWMLLQAEQGDAVVYLDADQLFFSSPQPILNQLQHVPVLIQPHAFPQRLEQKLLKFGRYNVGVVGVRQTSDGMKIIEWWKERCIEWCHSHYEEPDRFGDQKYLDRFIEISSDVGVMRHPGVGVAPWNHENAPFSVSSTGQIMYGKVPLVVFHYHSFIIVNDGVYIPARHNEDYQISLNTIEHCYIPYIIALDTAQKKIQAIDATFTMQSVSHEIEAGTALVIRSSLADAIDSSMPYRLSREVSGYHIYMPDMAPSHNLWEGSYATWEHACQMAGSYDSDEILNKTLAASRMARDGKIICERDSVALPHREYLLPTLAGILMGAARNNGRLHIIDFGGALGSTYRTCMPFLRHLVSVSWNIIELPKIVDIGKREFEDQSLHFYDSIEECLSHNSIDGILFGGALQYLPNPYEMLTSLNKYDFDYLIIDRTPFTNNGGHKICVQHVPKNIYNASYPCHIFDYTTLMESISPIFSIVDSIPALEGIVDDINFRGIIATAKK